MRKVRILIGAEKDPSFEERISKYMEEEGFKKVERVYRRAHSNDAAVVTDITFEGKDKYTLPEGKE